jgi:sugar phosphate isomerase/epimerase
MTVFDWIELAKPLSTAGLEMYEGVFACLEPTYLDSVREAISPAGFAMPMLCCSADFTNPDGDGRRRAVKHEMKMIGVTRWLGGPRAVRREQGAQRYAVVGISCSPPKC